MIWNLNFLRYGKYMIISISKKIIYLLIGLILLSLFVANTRYKFHTFTVNYSNAKGECVVRTNIYTGNSCIVADGSFLQQCTKEGKSQHIVCPGSFIDK